MSTLTRSDGTQFVIQAYRELVKYKKKALTAQRIRYIAESQGQFVRLFKRRTGEYEAVFSSEPGYLLGESVKQYFQQAKNLIFCEKIKDSKQNLLVIINDNNVFTDIIISDAQLKNELLPLTALKIPFQIVASGDSPLTNNPSEQTDEIFCFPKELTESFEHINAPLLPRLPTVPGVRLLPLPLALKSERLNNESFINTGILLLISLGVLVFIFFYFGDTQDSKPIITKTIKKVMPYSQYYTALQSPTPGVIIQSSLKIVEMFYQLPGWQLTSFHQEGSRYTIDLKLTGGNLHQLQQWANDNKFSLHLNPRGIRLTSEIIAPTRKRINHIYSLTDITATLLDTINDMLTDISVNLIQTTAHAKSKSNLLQLNLNDVSPQQLVLLNKILTNLPVVLNSIQLTLTQDSLLCGSIKLSVWGE